MMSDTAICPSAAAPVKAKDRRTQTLRVRRERGADQTVTIPVLLLAESTLHVALTAEADAERGVFLMLLPPESWAAAWGS
jgi:hypothetical protein